MPKKQLPTALRFIIRFFQKIIYLILQIPFIPFVIFGFILLGYKELVLSKKLGVDFTAEKIMQCRWFMHMFKTRENEAALRLYKALPIASHISLLGFMGVALIANRICGYLPSLAEIEAPEKTKRLSFANTRTVIFDQIMARNIDHIEQIVIMGAGYDMRVMKYAQGKNIRVFELDQEAIQNLKVEALKKAGIENNWISYVPIDFNNENWSEKLLKSGFDSEKQTFFHWEGVTLYLEEEVIRQTLQSITSISPKGSVLSFDFYSKSFITGVGSWSERMGMKAAKKSGHEFLFGIDTSGDEELKQFLKESGFSLKNVILIGKKTEKSDPFLGVAEAVVEWSIQMRSAQHITANICSASLRASPHFASALLQQNVIYSQNVI